LGHVLLTHYLWKNLLASTHDARIVQVSSLGALVSRHDTTDGWYQEKNSPPIKGKLHNTVDSMRYYFQSKRANLQQTWELHRRFANNNMTSVASHPGYTRSEIMLKYKLPLCPEFAMRWLRQNEWGSMSTKDGAKTQLFAALSPEVPSGSYVVPQYWTFGRPILLTSLMTSFSSHFYPFSESDSSRLWEKSLKALDISAFGE
jgi:NAD(P)-dependent dehydrogenase (short-subunit alcohol dehydrogenase family)